LTVKLNNTLNFIINPAKKTWAIIHPNITLLTSTNMSAHIMFTQTSHPPFFSGLSSPAFGEGVL